MTADYLKSINFLERYLVENHKIGELETTDYGNGKIVYGNEFVEYYVEERNDSGFIGCDSVEMVTQTLFQFYCPEDEDDFKKVMSILS